MKFVPWDCGIEASWKRSLDLRNISISESGVMLDLEDENGDLWELLFQPMQALKITTEECAARLLSDLPEAGAMYLVNESPWLDDLGEIGHTAGSQHYVICCYDQVVEIVATNCAIEAAAGDEERGHP